MQPRISLITLGVTDLRRSLKFYQQGLGFPAKPFDGQIVFFDLSGTWLALYPREELAKDAAASGTAAGFAGITLAHNVRRREQVDALLRQAELAGAKVVKPASDTSWGGYSGYFADPDGYRWEVAWNPHFWIGPPDAE